MAGSTKPKVKAKSKPKAKKTNNEATKARYRLVAQYFAQCGDKKQALMQAGYSESYAKARGFKIFERDDMKKYIAEYTALIQERNDLTVDWVISQYMNIAAVDATDIVQIVTKHREIDGKQIPYQDTEVKNTADLTPEQKAAIKSIKWTRYGINIEMYSKDMALNKLGEFLGMWRQNINLTGKIEGSNPFEDLTPEELRKIISSKGSG